jgi:hypothetical protein
MEECSLTSGLCDAAVVGFSLLGSNVFLDGHAVLGTLLSVALVYVGCFFFVYVLIRT